MDIERLFTLSFGIFLFTTGAAALIGTILADIRGGRF